MGAALSHRAATGAVCHCRSRRARCHTAGLAPRSTSSGRVSPHIVAGKVVDERVVEARHEHRRVVRVAAVPARAEAANVSARPPEAGGRQADRRIEADAEAEAKTDTATQRSVQAKAGSPLCAPGPVPHGQDVLPRLLVLPHERHGLGPIPPAADVRDVRWGRAVVRTDRDGVCHRTGQSQPQVFLNS